MVIVQTTEDHILTIRNMDARPSTVSTTRLAPRSRAHLRLQNTEGTAYQSNGKDVEGSPKMTEPASDPYDFRNAIKSEPELADLRKRKQGKSLASYYKRQNEVNTRSRCFEHDSQMSTNGSLSSRSSSQWRSIRRMPELRKRLRDYRYELSASFAMSISLLVG